MRFSAQAGFGGGRMAGLGAGGGGYRGEVAAADQGEGSDRGDGGDDGADEQDLVQAVGEAGPYGGGDGLRGRGGQARLSAAGARAPSPAAIAWACEARAVTRRPAGDGAAELPGEDCPERGDARREAGRPQRRVDTRTGM